MAEAIPSFHVLRRKIRPHHYGVIKENLMEYLRKLLVDFCGFHVARLKLCFEILDPAIFAQHSCWMSPIPKTRQMIRGKLAPHPIQGPHQGYFKTAAATRPGMLLTITVSYCS